MANSIAVIRALDSPEWNADVYGALSSLSRLAAAVKNRGTVIRLAYSLYSANRALKSLFEKVDAAMSGGLKSEPGAEVPTPQRLLDSADKLMKLSRDIDYIYELLRRVGLTNNSLTAGNLTKIRSYRGQIEDLADWFELMAQSDEVKAIFERASGERGRGEIFDLEPV
ncbi:MAG: hypothetical protein WAN12_10240 [Candidatus Acidiferrum sp.]